MKILLTGATGFVGRNVLKKITQDTNKVTCLVRPGTENKRLTLLDKTQIVKINLTDTALLRDFLEDNAFDVILHIGALRGGRSYSKKVFFNANVLATELLAENALKNNSKFVFCSSVGVFGAIPLELPANDHTIRQNDTYYHETKIEAEKIILNMVLKGLNAVIIRPAITYGPGDYGFPHTLVKLIDKKLLILPKSRHKIHLTDIELLVDAFVNVMNNEHAPGSAYIVADNAPVYIDELANFISQKLHNRDYAEKHKVSDSLFHLGEIIATTLRNDLWQSRFQLLSYSWYYDVKDSYTKLKLPTIKTIPTFNKVIYWYKNK
jgi:nucleoside-diphosphate-sugar epimerase